MKFESPLFQKVREYFTKLFTREVGDYMNPMRDWTRGLFLAVFLLLSGFSFFAFKFYIQFGVPSVDSVAEKLPMTYNESDVRFYADMFVAREALFNELRQNTHLAPLPVSVEVSSTTPVIVEEVPLAGDEIPQ